MEDHTKIDGEALRVAGENGILPGDILIWAQADRDRVGAYNKTYVLVTAERLAVVTATTGFFVSYENNTVSAVKITENISSCLVCAETEDAHILLTYTSFYAKNEFYSLAERFGKLKENGDPGEPDEKDECFCPKCGQRYPDRERKFCPNCMDKVKIVKRMGHFFGKYKGQMAMILLTLILLSALAVITPYVSNDFFYDSVLTVGGKFYGRIIFVVGMIVILRLLRVGVNVFNGIVTSKISAKIVYDLKRTIFEAIERLSMGYFTSRTTGGLMNQVYSDANTIYWFFTDGFPYFLINIVQLIAVIIIMLLINPLLTLFTMGLFPVVFILIGKLFATSRKLHAKRYSRSRALNGLLSDLLTGIRIVKSFSREKTETKRFDKSSRALAGADMKSARFGSTAFPLVNMIMYFGSVVVWGVGGWMVITGRGGMTYGSLLTFVAYITMVYDPMYFFVDMVQWASDSMNAMNRLFEVTDAQTDVKESENPVHIGSFEGDVVFDNVRFSYVKNRRIIDGVSFEVKPGCCVGIVGHTGAGKSTLANLLIRLYDADDGNITIDGINVRDIAFEDLRRNVSIVSQETYLFVGTIFDNIRYANPEATRDEVIKAAKAAGAHDFIAKLPDAYSTMVGFGYKELSGGEKQRVSIARALLRNPKILILDEATAAMDTQTERRIQATLDSLSEGRTTIMIAHRLSTLRNADHLIVINNGKMTEYGTHAELIAKKGEYYKLYKLQLDALKNVGVVE